ncbi:MBOAT family protein, partial [Pseudanabaenaceae cyanobacterium LEGE 13415]|nr:MBOAT family protein [Pseudanabaenaceae cyanobacterium LEGE 13415]
MNFADFSFWWTLVLCSAIVLGVRSMSRSLKLWSSSWDRLGLMVISLVIFYNAAQASFLIFITELVLNYLMVCVIQRLSGWKATLLATLTILANLLVLAYFKYLPFLIQDLLGIAIAPDQTSSIFPDLRQIPPGISFYTFQMVAFVVDSLRSTEKRNLGLIDYINFTSFFPQVVAGPIERRSDLLPQMQAFEFKFSAEAVELGLRWVVLG